MTRERWMIVTQQSRGIGDAGVKVTQQTRGVGDARFSIVLGSGPSASVVKSSEPIGTSTSKAETSGCAAAGRGREGLVGVNGPRDSAGPARVDAVSKAGEANRIALAGLEVCVGCFW
jgi:hypothetical protein